MLSSNSQVSTHDDIVFRGIAIHCLCSASVILSDALHSVVLLVCERLTVVEGTRINVGSPYVDRSVGRCLPFIEG